MTLFTISFFFALHARSLLLLLAGGVLGAYRLFAVTRQLHCLRACTKFLVRTNPRTIERPLGRGRFTAAPPPQTLPFLHSQQYANRQIHFLRSRLSAIMDFYVTSWSGLSSGKKTASFDLARAIKQSTSRPSSSNLPAFYEYMHTCASSCKHRLNAAADLYALDGSQNTVRYRGVGGGLTIRALREHCRRRRQVLRGLYEQKMPISYITSVVVLMHNHNIVTAKFNAVHVLHL